MKKNGYGKIIKDGIITQNPVLVQVLGMCPTLAVSTQLMNGLGMGAAVTAVLIFSNLFISLLRKVIDKRVRIASFIVIIAGFVTMVEMLMKAFLPSLSESLGVYIPLIVVNCIILARAEAFASRNKPLPSVVDGLACGVGFTGAICIVSAIRELLGTGALLGYDFKLIPPIMIFTLAPGGLLVLGFVMAFCAWIGKRRRAKSAPAEASPVQGEVSPKATEGLSASEKPQPALETQPPVLGLGPQLEKRDPARPVIEIVETAEAAEEIAPQSEALAPEASPYTGEPRTSDARPYADRLQSEAEASVILSEAKDPTPQADALQKEGDSSEAAPPRNDTSSGALRHLPLKGKASDAAQSDGDSSEAAPPRNDSVSAPETQSAPEEDAPAEGGAPSDEGAVPDGLPSGTEGGNALSETASDEITYASDEEREAALAAALRYFGGTVTEAETPEASPVQGEVSPKATEGLSVSEKPQSESGADNPSVIAAGGADSSPYTGEPRAIDNRPYGDAAQAEGDSSEARSRLLGMTETQPAPETQSAPETQPAPETPSAPAGRAARRASSSHTQLTFDVAEDDDLEPPSFMSEPVTRLRDRDKKEGR